MAARLIRLVLVLGVFWMPGVRAEQPARSLLLVASPELHDAFFGRSVILVTRQGAEGTIGVILNRPTRLRYGTPEERADNMGRTLYFGGPVSPHSVVYVFKGAVTDEARRDDLLSLGEGLSLGIGNDAFDAPLRHKGSTELKVFVGFASWNEGQLEDEIAHGAWFVAPLDPDVVFRQDATALWQELVAKFGRWSI